MQLEHIYIFKTTHFIYISQVGSVRGKLHVKTFLLHLFLATEASALAARQSAPGNTLPTRS